MELGTHCLKGMFSTAVEDGTSNALFRRPCSQLQWRKEPATHCFEGMFSEKQRMEAATHCLEHMFSTAVEDGTSNTLF